MTGMVLVGGNARLRLWPIYSDLAYHAITLFGIRLSGLDYPECGDR
jgi:hypothetical protein